MTSAKASPSQSLPISAHVLSLRVANGLRDADLCDALQLGVRSEVVSGVIAAGFVRPEGEDRGWERAMSVADRQIALMRLAVDHGQWPAWFVATCQHCQKPVDLRVRDDELDLRAPVSEPQKYVTVTDDDGESVQFRVPTGADEPFLETVDDRLAILAYLADDDALTLTDDLADSAEAALAMAAPEPIESLAYACPECGAENAFWFDPLDWIARHAGHCFADVHRLARAYGWAEAAILTMRPARRRMYLSFLEAAR